MDKNYNYILIDGVPTPEPDMIKWGDWFQKTDRRIALSTVGDVTISTVFLGLDHAFGYETKPILYETMIFGGEHDQYQERYHDMESAMRGHEYAVRLVEQGNTDDN